jgi:hypothetical protein
VAGDGTTWIGYWGEARFAALRVRFASSLIYEGGQSRTTTVVRGVPEPRLDEGRLTWDAAPLGARIEMIPRVKGVEREPYPGVVWRCLVPSADAVVELPGRTLRGRGYAEVLELSVAPWRLPIEELRWGRALGERTSLVWIQWKGGFPLNLVVRDGVFEEGSVISDDGVLAGGTELSISQRSVLREDRLAPTLAALKPLAWLFPKRLTSALEQKWRGRGTFRDSDRLIDEGWVIHELVKFAVD